MKHLTNIARITTPAAMVVFLTYELSRSLSVTGWWYAFLLIGSLATAVGVEIVGILAGHTLEGYWRLNNPGRAALSLILLLAYTAAAIHILRHSPALAVIPIIAAIVYILAGLTDGLHTAETSHDETAAAEQEYELEERRAQAEHRRRLQAAELRLKHEAKLARIQAKAAQASTEPAQSKSEPAHSRHQCEDCGRTFGTVQALNAHGRFCQGIPATNGKVQP